MIQQMLAIWFLSYKKEYIWVSPNKVDETGAFYTKWSKSERKTQILYINTIYGT